MSNVVYTFVLILVLITVPHTAHAYLDTGTGSIILQALLGGVAGALIAGRLYWQRIKEFLGLKPRPEGGSRPSDTDPDYS